MLFSMPSCRAIWNLAWPVKYRCLAPFLPRIPGLAPNSFHGIPGWYRYSALVAAGSGAWLVSLEFVGNNYGNKSRLACPNYMYDFWTIEQNIA